MASLLKRKGSNFWYVRYQVDGKRYFRSTGEEQKSKAEIRMHEMVAKNRSTASIDQLFGTVLERVSELSSEQQKIKRHDFARQLLAGSDAKVEISEAWSVWERSPRRGNPKESTVSHYEGIWLSFRKWLRESTHRIKFIHEISPAIAEEYAGSLWACRRLLLRCCTGNHDLGIAPTRLPLVITNGYLATAQQHSHRNDQDRDECNTFLHFTRPYERRE